MTLTITYLSHSGFILSDGSTSIAIDPFLTDNPLAVHKPADIKVQYIALTHGHFDHVGDTLAIAAANNATVIAAFELAQLLCEKGLAKSEPMNPGGQITTDFGFVALTPAIHSSSYEGRYTGMPCGLIINIAGKTFYHCGDTALFSDMKLLGEIYQPHIAAIPIGDRFTMGPDLAARAADLIQPAFAIPIHYNTWPPIAQNPAQSFKPTHPTVKILDPGQSWQLD